MKFDTTFIVNYKMSLGYPDAVAVFTILFQIATKIAKRENTVYLLTATDGILESGV